MEKFLDNSQVDKPEAQLNQITAIPYQPNNQQQTATNLNYSPQSLNNNLMSSRPSSQFFQNQITNFVREENRSAVNNNQEYEKKAVVKEQERKSTRSVKENFDPEQKNLKTSTNSKNCLVAFVILIIFTLFGGIIYWFKKIKTK